MKRLTLEHHDNNDGWLKAGELTFHRDQEVHFEYDLDYGTTHFGKKGSKSVSIRMPVNLHQIYKGHPLAFIIDLIPQGPQLKKLLARHNILRDDSYFEILSKAPLAPPGNLRIAEPWRDIEAERAQYQHEGFSIDEVLAKNLGFIEYMEDFGAPIGGTTGAGGGAPKFLLRQDFNDRYHADGVLDDSQTKKAIMLKFPFTDSQNSLDLVRAEKAYYDVLKRMSFKTHKEIQLKSNILFIERFDRIRNNGRLEYYGLESLYSANDKNVHGSPLNHEDNLKLLSQYSTEAHQDILEYFKRDLINQALCNTDNHGRNTSLLKKDESITLSPVYDVSPMLFFQEPITELTKWNSKNKDLGSRCRWLSEELDIHETDVKESLRQLLDDCKDLERHLKSSGVPQTFISRGESAREATIKSIKEVL